MFRFKSLNELDRMVEDASCLILARVGRRLTVGAKGVMNVRAKLGEGSMGKKKVKYNPFSEDTIKILDKEYPIRNGIIMALPGSLSTIVEANLEAKTFIDVHKELSLEAQGQDLLHNKEAMAKLQQHFYDRMAVGFQRMDDVDAAGSGTWIRKMNRMAKYDDRQIQRVIHNPHARMLFIGAGNCRLARTFAQMGYDVWATDISYNMLSVGKAVNEKQGVSMHYVAHNAELTFPFNSEQFDCAYSLCVMNHIVDWKTYFTEKLRCIKSKGVSLERMPNVNLWSFWKNQGDLYEGVEIKAKACTPENALAFLRAEGIVGEVWTHDGQTKLAYKLPLPSRMMRRQANYGLYRLRTWFEDTVFPSLNGIYTMIKVVKS